MDLHPSLIDDIIKGSSLWEAKLEYVINHSADKNEVEIQNLKIATARLHIESSSDSGFFPP